MSTRESPPIPAEAIEAAREAAQEAFYQHCTGGSRLELKERLRAALIAAAPFLVKAEREACAKVADERVAVLRRIKGELHDSDVTGNVLVDGKIQLSASIAKAIRERSHIGAASNSAFPSPPAIRARSQEAGGGL